VVIKGRKTKRNQEEAIIEESEIDVLVDVKYTTKKEFTKKGEELPTGGADY